MEESPWQLVQLVDRAGSWGPALAIGLIFFVIVLTGWKLVLLPFMAERAKIAASRAEEAESVRKQETAIAEGKVREAALNAEAARSHENASRAATEMARTLRSLVVRVSKLLKALDERGGE